MNDDDRPLICQPIYDERLPACLLKKEFFPPILEIGKAKTSQAYPIDYHRRVAIPRPVLSPSEVVVMLQCLRLRGMVVGFSSSLL